MKRRDLCSLAGFALAAGILFCSCGEKAVLSEKALELAKQCVRGDLELAEKARVQGSDTASLRRIQEPLALEENRLVFGEVELALPEGVTAVPLEKEAGEAGYILELAGAEPEDDVLPPLIRLDSFWAEYDGEQALAAAFLDELQGERIDCLYSDVRTESYSFRLDKGEFLCSILVRGEKAWLLWELAPEAEYSISGLMSEKLIRWSGALDEVGFGEKLRSYAVAEPEPDIRLVFCMCQEAEGEKNQKSSPVPVRGLRESLAGVRRSIAAGRF